MEKKDGKIIWTEEDQRKFDENLARSREESAKRWASYSPEQLKIQEAYGRHLFKVFQSSHGE